MAAVAGVATTGGTFVRNEVEGYDTYLLAYLTRSPHRSLTGAKPKHYKIMTKKKRKTDEVTILEYLGN